ncbi:DUF4149 domain-containing protein [Chitinimonas lacunae]|uniref:DUF4149 domain-containing protein n=1 Tax=Chitinimonas lacunae TaxID=1963018 RepID=A0ABV8MN69_9NEIS
MQPFPQALRAILTVLWVGGLWVIGVVVAPILFQQLDHAQAGRVAGALFRAMAWIGIVAGGYLVLDLLWQAGLAAFRSRTFWLLMAMLTLTLVNHFAVFPVIAALKPQMHAAAEGVFGGGFQSWHTISSLIYLLQSLLGLALVAAPGDSRR